jgi:hypothetical protein
MRFMSALVAVIVLLMAPSAQSVSLVVMPVNSNIGVAVAKVFMIGVQVTAADLATSPHATLFVQKDRLQRWQCEYSGSGRIGPGTRSALLSNP